MLQAAARDHVAGLGQRLDDGVVGVALVALLVEDALALEARRVLGHDAVGIDGEGDRRCRCRARSAWLPLAIQMM